MPAPTRRPGAPVLGIGRASAVHARTPEQKELSASRSSKRLSELMVSRLESSLRQIRDTVNRHGKQNVLGKLSQEDKDELERVYGIAKAALLQIDPSKDVEDL